MKNKTWIFCISVLAAVNILFFWPGNLYFLNDDLLHIPLTDQGHFFQTNSVRPIHELLVRFDLMLWGKKPFGFHLTALVLHFIVCFQLYIFCLRVQVQWLKIDRQQSIQAALLAVFLFLAYPQTSESLAWILGRTPVLSAVFLLMTINLFFSSNRGWCIYACTALFFAVTLFTYEQSFLLPIALFWVACDQKVRASRNSMNMHVLALSGIDILYIIARKIMTSQVVGSYEGANLIGLNWSSLASNSIRLLLRMILNPADKIPFVVAAIISIGLAIYAFIITVKAGINKNAVIFFTGATLLMIAPVVSLGIAVNSFESGRYLYLPSIFLLSGISIAAVHVARNNEDVKRRLVPILLLITGYWIWGKWNASRQYLEASTYAESMQVNVQQHFAKSADTLYIDKLYLTSHRLPVFRLGFKTGAKWFTPSIDTNKIVVKSYSDEGVNF